MISKKIQKNSDAYGVFVLSAGFGTRLRPLTEVLPKPLVPILDQPLISYIFEQFSAKHGIVLSCNAHHLRHELKEGVRAIACRLKERISVLEEEPEILGTAGGVHNVIVRLKLKDSLLCLNGDIYNECDYDAFFKAHKKLGYMVTIGLRERTNSKLTGFCLSNGRVMHAIGGVVSNTYFHSGLVALEPSIFKDIPPQGCLYRDFMKPLLEKGKLGGVVINGGKWADLGTPEDYFGFVMRMLAERGKKRVGAIQNGIKRLLPLYIGKEVEIGKNSILGPEVVVGRKARIGPGCRLRHVIIWDGVEVEGNQCFENGILYAKNRFLSVPN